MRNKLYYAVYNEDEEYVFGPFMSEEDAYDYAWQYSLRNGVDGSYGGSLTEVINKKAYLKRFPDGRLDNL
jgi:hypothetical protein